MLTTNDWHTPAQFSQCEYPGLNSASWLHEGDVDFNDYVPDIYPSWAGYTLESPSDIVLAPLGSINSVLQEPLVSPSIDASNVAVSEPTEDRSVNSRLPTRIERPPDDLEPAFIDGNHRIEVSPSPCISSRVRAGSLDPEAEHLLSLFAKIVQPPAAILISGVRNWRRLQDHLVAMSQCSEAVLQALLCVTGLLFIDETSRYSSQNRSMLQSRILERHRLAINGIRELVSERIESDRALYEPLLAAILLLAWYEVVRDQDGHATQFPRELADAVILSDVDWSRASRQLMSWLYVLDSKATHSSGEPLLSERALRVVARHPIQVVSSNPEEPDDETEHDSIERGLNIGKKRPGLLMAGNSPPHELRPLLSRGRIKQIVLHSVVQPAIEWYISTQAFCRRIGSHDRHHRGRDTPDDEYAVIVASKELEKDLWEVWRQRPTIISLTREELAQSLSMDLAIRLEELFSIHLASFWILFVYLHRVTWWHLPHSPTATAALTNVWLHLQNCYGEVIEGGGKKIVHPGLLWPLFLFGTECRDEYRQTWAIEQLEALGESRPMPSSQGPSQDTLPPFRLSPGATKNAKRAALLLKELIKEQNETKTRVDDRQLSMKMFGCYFSIV